LDRRFGSKDARSLGARFDSHRVVRVENVSPPVCLTSFVRTPGVPAQAELELQQLRWPRRSVAQVGPAAFAALSRSLVAGSIQGMCVCPAPPSTTSRGGGIGAQGGPGLGLRPGAATSGDGSGGGTSRGGHGSSGRHSPYVTPVLMVLFDNGSVQCYTSPAHLAVVEKETAAAAAATAAAAAAGAAKPAAAGPPASQPPESPSSPPAIAPGEGPAAGAAAAAAGTTSSSSGGLAAPKRSRVVAKDTSRLRNNSRLWQQPPPPVASPARRTPADRSHRTAWASYLNDASSDEELPVVSAAAATTSGRRSSSLRRGGGGGAEAQASPAVRAGGDGQRGQRRGSLSGQDSSSEDDLFVSFRPQVSGEKRELTHQ